MLANRVYHITLDGEIELDPKIKKLTINGLEDENYYAVSYPGRGPFTVHITEINVRASCGHLADDFDIPHCLVMTCNLYSEKCPVHALTRTGGTCNQAIPQEM